MSSMLIGEKTQKNIVTSRVVFILYRVGEKSPYTQTIRTSDSI